MSEPVFPSGDDLGRSRGTDFYRTDSWLGPEEREVRDRVRAFCDDELIPAAGGLWERAELPWELLKSYAGLGIVGGWIDGYGCPGLSPLADGMITAELARGDGSFSTFHGVHSGLAMGTIGRLGSEEQKQRWLPGMATLDTLGAFALTEPEHGSDVVAMSTRAVRDGSGWVLTGEKRWIGNGTIADVIIVWARDDDGKVGAFVVEHPDGAERPVAGFVAKPITGKTAHRAVWQAQITLDGVRVDGDARLAGANSFADTNKILAKSRQGVAWEAVGHAVAAYEAAVTYALRREQFGQPIASFQLVQDLLTRMLGNITASLAMVTRMAQLQDEDLLRDEQAALAKSYTTSRARETVSWAREVLGGNGILLDHSVMRFFADAEALYSYEGTREINALIVGRAITGESAFT